MVHNYLRSRYVLASAGLLSVMALTTSCRAQTTEPVAPAAAPATATASPANATSMDKNSAPVTQSAVTQVAVTVGIKNPDVVFSTSVDTKAPKISPLLGGAQFNFFDTPIRDRRENENLLNDWKASKVSVLRYPGGTWGDHYVWDHPEKSYFVANANENTIVTPAQFIEMCRKVGAEPIFQANALVRGKESSNWINPTKIETIREGAQWAAGWVREANIVNKWNVKYWEIGNELWIMYRPEEYATILAEYSKAMKAVDPSIKIIACGLSSEVGPFKLEWFKFKDDPDWKIRTANSNEPESWNKALFTIAKGRFDFIAPHPYISHIKPKDAPADAPEPVTRDIYLQTTAKIWDEAGLKTQYDALKKYNSPAKVAVTEWVTNFSYSVPAKNKLSFPMYFYSEGNGVNLAHYMGQIIKGEQNELAVMHSLDDTQTLYYWPKKAMSDKPLSHPTFQAFRLWNTHRGTRRTTSKMTREPMLKINGKEYPATFNYASEDDKNVYLMAINLDPDASHSFEWKPQNTKIGTKGVLSLLAGKTPSLDEANWDTWNMEAHNVDIRDSAITSKSGAFLFQLPPHSVAGITVPKTP